MNKMYETWEDFFEGISDVMETLEEDRLQHEGVPVYPPANQIFDAFEYFDPPNTKVVILGQDCYHGKGQAMGLAFSVPPEVKIPPSLRNIMRELESDVGVALHNGDLRHWADQGVLLLNCALTVREKKPGSHARHWKAVTDNIIKLLSQTQKNICFLLWGRHAQCKAPLIDPDPKKGHLVLRAVHPSPLAANQGGWFGNRHFSQANAFLEEAGRFPIDWGGSALALDKY